MPIAGRPSSTPVGPSGRTPRGSRSLVVALAAALAAVSCTSIDGPERRAAARRGTSSPPPAASMESGSSLHRPLAPVLRRGSPASVGVSPTHLRRMRGAVRAGLSLAPGRPGYPGAVVLAAKDGVVVEHAAYGWAVAHADATSGPLPGRARVRMRRDTIFDLASITKLFTSIAAMQLVERGKLRLGQRVASVIPEFAAEGKRDIRVRHLLTHTSGLPAWMPLFEVQGPRRERLAAALAATPLHPPASRSLYSDLNMIVLGEVVERVSGLRLDAFVEANIARPLGMTDTGYRPPGAKRRRIAATEHQPWAGRGMVRGSVHDENAWSLGGVAGHAGIFGTAWDLAVLAQAILNGGRYGEVRILRRATVRTMLRNHTADFPGDDHGLGFELDQPWYMGALASPSTAGHTGFTGTSLVLDPRTDAFLVLLTNRVHPSRAWGGINHVRRAVADHFARAIASRP